MSEASTPLPLIEGINEQQKQIQNLKDENLDLKNQISNIFEIINK